MGINDRDDGYWQRPPRPSVMTKVEVAAVEVAAVEVAAVKIAVQAEEEAEADKEKGGFCHQNDQNYGALKEISSQTDDSTS